MKVIIKIVVLFLFFSTTSLKAGEQFWILIRTAITPNYILNGDYKYGIMTSETTKDIFKLKKNCKGELKKDFNYDKNQEGSKVFLENLNGPSPFYIIEFLTVGMVIKAECDKVRIKD